MTVLEDAAELAAAALGGQPAGLSGGELAGEVRAAFRLRNLAMARLLEVLPEADVRAVGGWLGYTRSKVWLADEGRITTTEAGNLLKLAHQLQTVEHQPVNDALATGDMTGGHARQIVQRLATLPTDVDTETQGKVRDHLIDQARFLDPKALGHQVEAVLEVEAPDILQREHEDQAARHELHAGRRELSITRNADHNGMAHVRGWLPGPDADVIVETLHRIAYPANQATSTNGHGGDHGGGGDGPEAEDDRTPGQRLCDALCEHFTGDRSYAATNSTAAANRPRVMVTVDWDDLRNQHGIGRLDQSGQPVTAETARQVACDAGIIPALLNSEGVPLDLGREQRLVTTKLRQALELRDKGCIFPGCTAPLSRVDAHHVNHWADGGTTTTNNLVLLCRRHHTLTHHSHWRIRIEPGRHPEVHPPARATNDEPRTPPEPRHQSQAHSPPAAASQPNTPRDRGAEHDDRDTGRRHEVMLTRTASRPAPPARQCPRAPRAGPTRNSPMRDRP